ncbi:VWA domain-containing protein [Candidatus Woesearchaeota archaeon]|nr:VWA domain-containing protein [Candidatus Woesearchaeota archaeon]
MISFEYPFMIFTGVMVALLVAIFIKRNFIRFEDKHEKNDYLLSRKTKRRIIVITRCLVVLLLSIALSSPFAFKEKRIQGEASLTLLVDNSSSMGIFDTERLSVLKEQLEQELPVTVRYIGQESNTALGDDIVTNINGNDNVLAITDGQSNDGRSLGEVMMFAASINSTISTLFLDLKRDDASVFIDGPSEVISDTENPFRVSVKNTGETDYKLKVFFDGSLIHNDYHKGSFDFDFTRPIPRGQHTITAEIEIQDYFSNNNKYYKVVEGLPKPKITVVTDRDSSMMQLLRQVYAVTELREIPKSLDGINALLLINRPIRSIEPHFSKLNDYLTDGKGMVVVGGTNSFDYAGYKDSLFETLLPVRVGKGQQEKDGDVNIVIVIDISMSTGRRFSSESDDSKVDVEKALAISVVDSLSPIDKVAVVAFNTEGFLVHPLSTLDDRLEVQSKIASLKQGGGTVMPMGLTEAYKQIAGARGSRHIIVISDGKTLMKEETLSYAEQLCNEGIKTYTVGVGEGTLSGFMRAVADAGCTNFYFEPTQMQQLKILFGEEDKEEAQKLGKTLVVMNRNHFITQNIDLDAYVTGYNSVMPKTAGQLLVTTRNNNPVLAAWRFGLGRVAVFTVDDTRWLGNLLSKNNSKLVIRAINWAAGDVSKEQLFSIKTKNLVVNEKNALLFYSKTVPPVEPYVKIADGTYSYDVVPTEQGFMDIMSGKVAVNYPVEYQNTGQSKEWLELVKMTNGRVFSMNDVQAITQKVITDSTKKQLSKVYYRWPFVLLAALIFLVDISARTMKRAS